MRKNPVILTIFGITGHLSQTKLLPAIFRLYELNRLSDFILIGFGRRDLSQENFERLIATAIGKAVPSDLLAQCHYFKGNLDSAASFTALHQKINELEQGRHYIRLFYYAVAPEFILSVSNQLVLCGLSSGARICIEKPFGHDLAAARSLNTELHRHFTEDQIFRVDHYLHKNLVINIHQFRYLKEKTEVFWNNKHIEHITITLTDTAGIEGRGEYYDKNGEIRDMFQNHALEVLTALTMETPNRPWQTEDVRTKRTELLRATNVTDFIIGQYEGYHDDPEVKPDSTTETYVFAQVTINTPFWHGIPVSITCGKKCAPQTTEAVVYFKNGESQRFTARGINREYTSVLSGIMQPIHTHFIRDDEVEAAWQVVEPMLQQLPNKMPLPYKSGSKGPKING